MPARDAYVTHQTHVRNETCLRLLFLMLIAATNHFIKTWELYDHDLDSANNFQLRCNIDLNPYRHRIKLYDLLLESAEST